MTSSKKPYVIVVGVDYSEVGDLAFQRALELAAEKRSAEIHAINVVPLVASELPPDVPAAWVGGLPTLKEAAEKLRSHVERQVTAFRAEHEASKLGFLETICVHQRLEVPAEQLAQLAADVEADLIVVGMHGRRGISRLLLGSVAEATIRLAPCPVLGVRPKAIPAPVPAIEPPCPRCLEARRASGGAELWCAQHREHHGQRHTYHQADRVGAETNLPLVVRE
jgi:nucleotide-binding universal stress UspA family protein